jgi:hypothetical protein
MMNQGEQEIIEELAAALIGSLSQAIISCSNDASNDAYHELGADDGMEVDLPGVVSEPHIGSEYVAEELLTRPELKTALQSVATMLLIKLKTGV